MSVCVVGGGPSGLTTAKWMREEGFQVTVYEEDNTLGGMWLFEKQRVYHSLSTNSSRQMMEFSDFPFPKEIEAEEYPAASKIVAYYQAYAKHFDLEPLVQFDTRVVEVMPLLNEARPNFPRWKVTTTSTRTGQQQMHTYDAIAVCCGLYRTPKLVSWPGQNHFAGVVEHSQTYRSPDKYKDQTVVVVGAGNSCMDIALELAESAKKVVVSCRSGGVMLVPVFDPNTQRPADATQLTRKMFYETPPSSFFKSIAADAAKWQKEFHRHGMPALPREREQLRFAVIKRPDAWVEQLRKKKIVFQPGIEAFSPNGRDVRFASQRVEQGVGAVLLCTGYANLDFPFLPALPNTPPSLQLCPSLDNEYLSLYRHILHPRFHSLGFMGFVDSPGNLAVVSEVQARWFAAVLRKRVQVPCENTALSVCAEQFKSRPSPKRGYWIVYVKYMDQLAQDLGITPTILHTRSGREQLKKSSPALSKALREGGVRGIHYRLGGPRSLPGAAKELLATDQIFFPPGTARSTTAKL